MWPFNRKKKQSGIPKNQNPPPMPHSSSSYDSTLRDMMALGLLSSSINQECNDNSHHSSHDSHSSSNDFSGGGGSFDGAGASGGWDSGSDIGSSSSDSGSSYSSND